MSSQIPQQHFSFEFYPPKTDEGAANLALVHEQLKALNPEFFSVTFGAGGSTRDKTFGTVVKIQQNGVPAAPHLSCVASTKKISVKFCKPTKTTALPKL